MRVTDASSAVHSPRATATGYVAPWGFPLLAAFPRRPHSSMGAFPWPSAYPEVSTISFKASFSARSLTTRTSCPGSPRPCDDSGSDPPRYVRHPDTVCTSLKPVVQFTVHARQRPALQHPGASPLLAAFLAAPTPPWAHSQASCIPRCRFDII